MKQPSVQTQQPVEIHLCRNSGKPSKKTMQLLAKMFAAAYERKSAQRPGGLA